MTSDNRSIGSVIRVFDALVFGLGQSRAQATLSGLKCWSIFILERRGAVSAVHESPSLSHQTQGFANCARQTFLIAGIMP
jgi:hypothetical protein